MPVYRHAIEGKFNIRMSLSQNILSLGKDCVFKKINTMSLFFFQHFFLSASSQQLTVLNNLSSMKSKEIFF